MKEKYFHEKMPHLLTGQRRQVKATPHFGSWKFRDYSMAWILQVPTWELKGALFVPYLTNPETTKHRSTAYRQGSTRLFHQLEGKSQRDTYRYQRPITAQHVSISEANHNTTRVNVRTKLETLFYKRGSFSHNNP